MTWPKLCPRYPVAREQLVVDSNSNLPTSCCRHYDPSWSYSSSAESEKSCLAFRFHSRCCVDSCCRALPERTRPWPDRERASSKSQTNEPTACNRSPRAKRRDTRTLWNRRRNESCEIRGSMRRIKCTQTWRGDWETTWEMCRGSVAPCWRIWVLRSCVPLGRSILAE